MSTHNICFHGVIRKLLTEYCNNPKYWDTLSTYHTPKILNRTFYYRIRPNYRTYPYKRTVKRFRSLQIIISVRFVYFFINAYVVGTHLNCIDLSMQFK